MKLFFFGILSLIGSSVSLKMHGQSHLHASEQIKDKKTAASEFVQKKFDADEDGALDVNQFRKFVKKAGGKKNDAKNAFKVLDTDKDGKISQEELKKLPEAKVYFMFEGGPNEEANEEQESEEETGEETKGKTAAEPSEDAPTQAAAE